MSLTAGSLRQRVSIQKQKPTYDPISNDPTMAWVDVFDTTIPASVEPLSAREFIAAQATRSEADARITVRFTTAITSTMRVVHGEDIYNIQGVLADADSGREYLTLICSRGLTDGS